MRKYSWILALLAALAMIFVGCGDSGGGGGGGEEPGGYEYPVDTKFIQVTQRSENWHTIDIKAGFSFSKGELNVTDFYTEDKDHVITVFGRAPGATNVYFAGAKNPTEAPEGGGQASLSGHTFVALDKGEFTLTRTFTWAEISRNNDIRINGFEGTIPYINFYEITIVDADDKVVYALSEDNDIQSKEHDDVILQENPPKSTTWLVGALGGDAGHAIGKVFDPATASGPCCTDCDAECADCDLGLCNGKCGDECCVPPSAWQLALDSGYIGFRDATLTASDDGLLFKRGTGEYSHNGGMVIDVATLRALKGGTPAADIVITGTTDSEVDLIIQGAKNGSDPITATPDAATGAFSITIPGDAIITPVSWANNSVPFLGTEPNPGTQAGPNVNADIFVSSIKIGGTEILELLAGPAKLVDVFAITIAAPATNATPATTISAAQFTGAVTWTGTLDEGKFAATTAYTANIVLTARNGFTLEGLANNAAFTVTGATTVSYASATKTVTAVFPATGAALDDITIEPTSAAETLLEPGFTNSVIWGGTATYTYDSKDWWVLWRDAGNLNGAGLSALTAVAAWLEEEDADDFVDNQVGSGSEALARLRYVFEIDDLEVLAQYAKVTITYDLINIDGSMTAMVRSAAENSHGQGINGPGLSNGTFELEEGTGKTLTFTTAQYFTSKADGTDIAIILNTNGVNLFRVTKIEILAE